MMWCVGARFWDIASGTLAPFRQKSGRRRSGSRAAALLLVVPVSHVNAEDLKPSQDRVLSHYISVQCQHFCNK